MYLSCLVHEIFDSDIDSRQTVVQNIGVLGFPAIPVLRQYTRGDQKVRIFFLIQKNLLILSKFCDVRIEIKYISSNWMLFEK